ncbi:MAG TPA: hypothetical protein VFS40_11560 [Gemmatimonadales bacterium]|nr:hypothetical protein [Gemmatimonadales bacterium]
MMPARRPLRVTGAQQWRRSSLLAGAAAVIVGTGACGLVEPDTRRVVGLIAAGGPAGAAVIEGPDTLRVGQGASFTINTFGSSSCTQPDGAAVAVTGLVAEVTPYDRVPRGDTYCTADIGARPHPVTLTFAQPGTAIIRVLGESFDARGRRVRDTVTATRPVLP